MNVIEEAEMVKRLPERTKNGAALAAVCRTNRRRKAVIARGSAHSYFAAARKVREWVTYFEKVCVNRPRLSFICGTPL
jgi:hypothetical protein